MLESGCVFGKFTIIEFDHKILASHGYRYYYRCRCSCDGKEIIVREDGLKSGHTKSCGCLQKETAKKLMYKHGLTNTRFYKLFDNMYSRCSGYKYCDNKNYKQKGITVCDRWHDFNNFKEDMYESYCEHVEKFGEKDTTLDRIDSNMSYCPENCRWATRKEQANNTKNNHRIEYKGESHTLAEWANILDIGYKCLSTRVKRGWPIDRAFNEKIHTKGACIC